MHTGLPWQSTSLYGLPRVTTHEQKQKRKQKRNWVSSLFLRELAFAKNQAYEGFAVTSRSRSHLRRGDPPACGERTVARSVEDRVGVGLVLRGGHRDAPVKQLQHLVLDAGEQGDVDVQDGTQDVVKLPGPSGREGVN